MKRTIMLLGACAVIAPGIALSQTADAPAGTAPPAAGAAPEAPAPAGAEDGVAVFAGGCFWCVEEAFDKVEGVTETTSGYTGGTVENPTYELVTAGDTGHYEALQVRYDPAVVTYAQLLDTFWRNVDPVDGGGQFCDRGESYLSAVFVEDDAEREAAQASKEAVATQLSAEIATEILPEAEFYPAEDYHQNYYQENPARYTFYKWSCGRAQRLEEIWGPPATN